MDSDGLVIFRELISGMELVLCLGVAAVLARRWRSRGPRRRRHRRLRRSPASDDDASGWAAPSDVTRGWGALWSDLIVCILLSISYLLARFTWTLGGLSDRTHLALAGLLGLEWLATLALPPLPEPGGVQPDWFLGYLVFVLAAWTVQCLAAAAGLWRTGQGQSSVVRHRMRSLSTGGLLLALTLVLSGAVGEQAPGAFQVVVGLLGLLSILLFALAFLPPPALRLLWRQADLAALSSAERGLMTALTRDDVAGTIVPVVAKVFGGGGATLLDSAARPVRAVGLTAEQITQLTPMLHAHGDELRQATAEAGLLVVPLTEGWLVVQAGLLAPVFGNDEAMLLDRVGTLVDLALQRAVLFDQERISRQLAESANAELETLLYSVSHDLRSPLISVLGYLDVLTQEHASELTGEGPHFLDRISVNALYMQSLISDLLELSRIGRGDHPTEQLDLHRVAEQVVEGARMSHPRATLQVLGVLPVVHMSDVRARQLLTNLVDNALKHGGRDDLSVTIRADTGPAGHLLLQVADDGQGIPVEYRARVLLVFERLDPSRSSSGTGMGLAICKRIVERFGGGLEVGGPPASATSGTTISIELPAGIVVEPRLPEPRENPEGCVDRMTLEETA